MYPGSSMNPGAAYLRSRALPVRPRSDPFSVLDDWVVIAHWPGLDGCEGCISFEKYFRCRHILVPDSLILLTGLYVIHIVQLG